MDPIRADEIALTDNDLRRLAGRYGIGRLERLGSFENVILRAFDQPRVVRLTHTSRRSLAAIEAEASFVQHLSRGGVPVATPVETNDGLLATPFETEAGQSCIVYCMTEAPGSIRLPAAWSEGDIVAYGDLLSRAHAVAARFKPKDGARRPVWTDPIFDWGAPNVADREALETFYQAKQHAVDHPAGGSDLLIHQDAHFWNLHVAEGSRLTLFDFDDCAYATAEHDIAIVLFYWMLVGWPDPATELRRFLPLFFSGYDRHATLSGDWPEGVDRILKVRETEIYLLLTMEDIEPNGIEAGFMRGRRERVLAGIPYLGAPVEDLL